MTSPKPNASRRLWPFLAVPALAVVVAATIYLGDFTAEDVGLGGGADETLPGSQADESDAADSSMQPSEEELRAAAQDQLQADLDAKIEDYLAGLEEDENRYVSVAVSDSEFDLEYNGDEQHQTASIVKTEILTMMLQEYGTVEEIPDWAMDAAELMIKDSDNDATNEIFFGCWEDPRAELEQAHEDLGMTDTEPDPSERWGLTETTANDQLKLLEQALFEGTLTAEEVELSRDLMGNLSDFQQWGVDAAAQDGETVWMKNGWDTRDVVDGEWIVNSIGVIAGDTENPIELAIMTGGTVSHEEGITMTEDIAKIAREVIDTDPYA